MIPRQDGRCASNFVDFATFQHSLWNVGLLPVHPGICPSQPSCSTGDWTTYLCPLRSRVSGLGNLGRHSVWLRPHLAFWLSKLQTVTHEHPRSRCCDLGALHMLTLLGMPTSYQKKSGPTQQSVWKGGSVRNRPDVEGTKGTLKLTWEKCCWQQINTKSERLNFGELLGGCWCFFAIGK